MRFSHWLLCLMLVPSVVCANTIVAFGDSLTAAYGINPDDGWVNLLQQRLDSQGYDYQVINASISGDTTYTGRQRFNSMLKNHQPDILIIGLGSNDGRLGLKISGINENLTAMIELSSEQNIQVLLLGFKIPVNYGKEYREQFEGIFQKLATQYQLAYVPFMLEGIALQEGYMLDDNLHPNEKAQPKILDNIWPSLEPLLNKT